MEDEKNGLDEKSNATGKFPITVENRVQGRQMENQVL
jgi:hypothetical protein